MGMLDELIAQGVVPPEIRTQMESARAPQVGWERAGGGERAPWQGWQEAPTQQKMSDFTGSAFAPTVADLYPDQRMAEAYLKMRGFDPRRVAPWQVPLKGEEEKLYRDRRQAARTEWDANRQAELARQGERRITEMERHNRELERARMATERRAVEQANAKPLPNPLREQLTSATQSAEGMQSQIANFRPEYGGNVVMGEMENVLKRWFPTLEAATGTRGQADWWSAMTGLDNIIRHPLFGSAFTSTEKALWKETTITPRDDAQTIEKNLERRAVTLNRAMKRLVESAGVRYDAREIEALTGMRPTTARQRPPLDQILGPRR